MIVLEPREKKDSSALNPVVYCGICTFLKNVCLHHLNDSSPLEKCDFTLSLKASNELDEWQRPCKSGCFLTSV